MGGGAGPAVPLPDDATPAEKAPADDAQAPIDLVSELPSPMAVRVTQTTPVMLLSLSPFTKQLLWSLVLPTCWLPQTLLRTCSMTCMRRWSRSFLRNRPSHLLATLPLQRPS